MLMPLISQDILESSGANNFFTLVRYNPPELLEDYNYFKKLEKQEKDQQRISDEDDIKTLSSFPSEEAETAEDIIFTLFGPRVWEHNGEPFSWLPIWQLCFLLSFFMPSSVHIGLLSFSRCLSLLAISLSLSSPQ